MFASEETAAPNPVSEAKTGRKARFRGWLWRKTPYIFVFLPFVGLVRPAAVA